MPTPDQLRAIGLGTLADVIEGAQRQFPERLADPTPGGALVAASDLRPAGPSVVDAIIEVDGVSIDELGRELPDPGLLGGQVGGHVGGHCHVCGAEFVKCRHCDDLLCECDDF